MRLRVLAGAAVALGAWSLLIPNAVALPTAPRSAITTADALDPGAPVCRCSSHRAAGSRKPDHPSPRRDERRHLAIRADLVGNAKVGNQFAIVVKKEVDEGR